MKLNALAGFFVLSSITYASEPIDISITAACSKCSTSRLAEHRSEPSFVSIIDFSLVSHEPFLEEVVAPSLRRTHRMDTSFQEINSELSRGIDLDALPGVTR